MRVMPDSMSPLRYLLLTITFLLTFTFSPAVTPFGTLRAEESPRQDPPLEEQKLDLEVKELRHKLSAWGKIERNAAVIGATLAFISAVVGTILTFRSRNKELRLNTVTNLKRELASENLAVRITTVHALADYPKEAIPTLIASLGSIKPTKGEGHSSPEEDTAFTKAVKDSLRQIGKEAVPPLIEELRRIQGEIRNSLMSGGDEKFQKLYRTIPFSIFNFDEGTKAVSETLKTVVGWKGINLGDEEINRVVEKLDSIRSSKHEEVVANKNGIEILSYLLCTYNIKSLELSNIDLSGAHLREAYLKGADLLKADLSGARLGGAQLIGAYLERANLTGASLSGADLSDAHLSGANLSGAYLGGADLSGAYLGWVYPFPPGATLDRVDGFTDVKGFRKTDLRGVKGLSKEDLEYAKSRGAIIDEPAAEEPKQPAE